MQRKIVDYKKLSHEVAAKLIDRYPHGYGDDDIYVFQKPNGEIVEAVEVKTENTIYLVKISKSLSNFMTNFAEAIESEMNTEEDVSAKLPDVGQTDAS